MTEDVRPAAPEEQKANRRLVLGTLAFFAIPLFGFLAFVMFAAFSR